MRLDSQQAGYGKVMVVEDAPDVFEFIRTYLEREGFETVVATDGETALKLLPSARPDLVVLDVMLPDIDGLTVCKEIRKSSKVPILMLSARDTDVDVILGIEMGADDYVTKPFNPKELVTRVRALLRRVRLDTEQEVVTDDVLVHKNIRLFVRHKQAEVDGKAVSLTPVEYALLKNLVEAGGKTISRQELVTAVWGAECVGHERTLDSHIRNLRRKLYAVSPDSHYVTSVWGVGYRLLV